MEASYTTTSPSICPPPRILPRPVIGDRFNTSGTREQSRLVLHGHTPIEIGRIKVLSVSDQGMLPKSHSRLGRKRLGLPRQVPRHWQAFLRQDLYRVATGSVLGFPSAILLVLSQLECPVSFFAAASTSAPPYKADPKHLRHCPLWSPFTTSGSVRGWVFYFPLISREGAHQIFEHQSRLLLLL